MGHFSRSNVREVLFIVLLSCALLWSSCAVSSLAQTLPTLPQVLLDTTYTPPAGNVITVNAAGETFEFTPEPASHP